MRGRKPSLKERIIGCWPIFKEIIIGVFDFNIAYIEFNWLLLKETLKGNFEVMDSFRMNNYWEE